MIKKIFFYLFILLIPVKTHAQSNMGFVDLKYLIAESNAGKKINKILTNQRKAETEKLKKIQVKLKKQEQEIKSKSNILNENEIKENIQKFKSDVNNYNKLKNKKEKEFNLKKAEYINKLLAVINKIMIEYIDKNSIDIVIKKENLITAKKELDITMFILEELNKKKIDF